jgi:hypothetical protein
MLTHPSSWLFARALIAGIRSAPRLQRSRWQDRLLTHLSSWWIGVDIKTPAIHEM